jgi:2-methylaconitate cis-trans-isomerase PrpF
LTEGSEMNESYVRDELFDKAKEVGEFEVFPTPSEADEDLDNAFLISTGILFGVPKMFIVRVEEFHYTGEEGDKETDKILKQQERHIKRVLSEHKIELSEAAWNTVFSYAVLDVHPSRTSGQLSEDEMRSVEEAFDALGLDP